jgi:hypothetical protein
MSALTHTPGPWRWEYNAKHRSVHLVGGKPMYDLTVMDFERWGMHGAVPRFIEPSESSNGLMLMHRLCDRQDWIAPFENREHHAHWCAAVTHPDARLMSAAPDLLAALKEVIALAMRDWNVPHEDLMGIAERSLNAIKKATGEQS